MLTLDQLVENRTVAPDGASLLRRIGAAGESFLVYSRPRNAGKSTLLEAVLSEAPSTMIRHDFLGTESEMAALRAHPPDGYVVVAEMGHRGMPGYLAGEEVVRAFSLASLGYPLASSLHAATVDEVFDVLSQNGVSVATASMLRYLIKVQPLGDPFEPLTRRVVEAVYETTGIEEGSKRTTVLYEWAGRS